MKTLKVLPQRIFKFKCKSSLIDATLKTLQEETIRDDGREEWKIRQTDNTRLNKVDRYSEIHGWVRKCLNEVKDEMSFRCDRIEITSSWGNIAKENQWHWIHSHPNSFMSAILYLTDSNAYTWFSMNNFWTGSNNNLEYPANTSNIIKVINEEDEDNLIIHKQSTVAGDLIVFPSTLVHSVDAHTIKEHDRWSLSFNSYPCGLIGNMERSSGIILEVL